MRFMNRKAVVKIPLFTRIIHSPKQTFYQNSRLKNLFINKQFQTATFYLHVNNHSKTSRYRLNTAAGFSDGHQFIQIFNPVHHRRGRAAGKMTDAADIGRQNHIRLQRMQAV